MPDKLFKYRAFNVLTLRLITDAEVYYSAPKAFNDPLDCDPTIEVDVSRDDMEKLYFHILMSQFGKVKARKAVHELRYFATEESDWENTLQKLLAEHIKNQIDAELGSVGVLSMSATWSSALMWSHYADEHKGICIEYDTRGQPHDRLKAVSYNAARAIAVSDIIKWKIKGDDQAEKRVCDTYFYAKSREWRYEKEWRDIADKPGVDETPFLLSAIHFGLRCDSAVITSIVKLLNRDQDVKLWGIRPKQDSFDLRRERIQRDEIEAHGVRAPSFLLFQDIIWGDDEAESDLLAGEAYADLGADDDLGVDASER